VIDPEGVRWSAPVSERAGRPLLVVLHGHGLNEDVGSELWDRLPDELVIAAPRGPLRARGGYGWFQMDFSLTLADVDAAATSVLTWLDGQTGFTSVGILGFSQGSAVAVQALRLQPDRLDYAVVLSGFMVPLPAAGDARLAQRRPPAFAARGDRDRLVPGFLATFTDHWLADHTALTLRRYPDLGHAVSEAELSDLRSFVAKQLSTNPVDRA
jgi:phospholipase/carboxylesterase